MFRREPNFAIGATESSGWNRRRSIEILKELIASAGQWTKPDLLRAFGISSIKDAGKSRGRLIATLEFTSEFHRNRLELESLADNSDIQLAILPPERGATARLVEVRFPENFPLVEAKRILLEELQTILIHTSSPGYCLEATEDMFLLRFTESAWDASLCLSKGICEKLTGLETSAISFEKRAGWNVHSIQSWMNLNLPGRKVSRVFCLETGCNSL